MIEVGHIVAVPWGLDDIEVQVLEIYTSGGVKRALVTDDRDVCASCGRGDPQTLVVPLSSVRLLPAKPLGSWYRSQ